MAAAINIVHGDLDVEGENKDFFIYENGTLKVNPALEDASLVKTGRVNEEGSPDGDGSRALAISRLRTTRIEFSDNPQFSQGDINDEDLTLIDQRTGITIGGYYNNIVTGIGISKEHADNMVENQDILLGQLELRREAISGVNIDEEITNLIRFQSAYGANARVISTLSEMLDTLINRMGV